MSDICAAELDALSPFELELVARALQLRQPLTAAALSARLASLSAQQQSTQLVSCVFALADCDTEAQVASRRRRRHVARPRGVGRRDQEEDERERPHRQGRSAGAVRPVNERGVGWSVRSAGGSFVRDFPADCLPKMDTYTTVADLSSQPDRAG